MCGRMIGYVIGCNGLHDITVGKKGGTDQKEDDITQLSFLCGARKNEQVIHKKRGGENEKACSIFISTSVILLCLVR
jgi:hypothetical protein